MAVHALAPATVVEFSASPRAETGEGRGIPSKIVCEPERTAMGAPAENSRCRGLTAIVGRPAFSRMSDRHFRLNEPDVTFESFEGEILLINLANGNYYSLRGSAPVVWPWLIQGHTVEKIAATVATLCAQPVATIQREVQAFVDQLLQAKLITPRAEAPVDAIDATGATIATYAAPSVEAYNDMQDLLMLDPIHEVDVTGWPRRPAGE